MKWLFICFVLSSLSTLLLLPFPWYQQNLVSAEGFINPEENSIQLINAPIQFSGAIHAFIETLKITSDVGFYDLHIENPNRHDWIYALSFSEDDPILSYLQEKLGIATPQIDGHPGFTIEPGRKYKIGPIPTEVSVYDRYGILATCGFKTQPMNCPTSVEDMVPDPLKIYATPNLGAWFAHSILIFGFWIVVVNNLHDLLTRSRKRE